MWFYGGDEITSSELQQLDRETQLKVMRDWFFSIYEDPVHNTPHDSSEGGYIFIWGGPYEASEELGDEFGGIVPDKIIDELVSELNDISGVWTNHPEGSPEVPIEELDEFEITISNTLPDPLPSPVSFEIRDGAVHKAPHSTPALPDERRAGAESAWMALKELLADLAASPARQNHPSIDRVLDRCRSALGDEFQQLKVIMLGVHASRVDQIALRADEILMPGDAADLVAFNDQLGLFLAQFPDWIEYARGIDDPFGSDGAEQKAVSDASAAVRAMREKAPNLLAPDATDALKGLEEDATPETDVDGPSAFAPPNSRRSYLRASRDLLLKLSSVVIISVKKGMEKGIERHLRAMIIDALSAASTWLIDLATGLLPEFGWLTGIRAYLARILGTSSIERTENGNDAPPNN